jgi:hypothetical protein
MRGTPQPGSSLPVGDTAGGPDAESAKWDPASEAKAAATCRPALILLISSAWHLFS